VKDFWDGYVPEPTQPRAWFTVDELNAWADKKLKENPQWAQQEAVCGWQREDDDHMPDTWRSDCGVMWTFTDGSPVDNQMKYCCGCGAILLEKAA
jgi:hypothetical protein